MKKSIQLPTKVTLVLTLILLCFTFSCQQQDASKELKSIVQAFNEPWNTGDLDALDAVVDPQYVRHTNSGPIVGLDSLKQDISSVRTAFPDWHCTYDEEIYAGDKAVVRSTVTGTHTGPGLFGPPTGKKIELTGITIFRVADGKVVDDRAAFNALALYQQLGYTLVPPSGSED
jgi:predicted ester cyclase